MQKTDSKGNKWQRRWWHLNTENDKKLRYFDKDQSATIAKGKMPRAKGEIELGNDKTRHVGPCLDKKIIALCVFFIILFYFYFFFIFCLIFFYFLCLKFEETGSQHTQTHTHKKKYKQ